jgi:hypothetical protein
VAERYEAIIRRTREISKTVTKISGWDPAQSKRVVGSIQSAAEAPFRLNTQFIGGIHVLGQAHPLILAAPATFGLPQSTDIARPARLVRFVPIADSCTAASAAPKELAENSGDFAAAGTRFARLT